MKPTAWASPIGRTLFLAAELLPNQTECIDRCVRIIEGFRHANRKSGPPSEFPWYEELNQPTQVVSILGARGTGKSACLLSLCRLLDGKSGDENETHPKRPYSVLPVIIPESLTGRESLLQVFVINLLRMVDHVEGPIAGRSRTEIDEAKDKVRSQLAKVLAALVLGTEGGQELVQQVSGDLDAYTRRFAGYQATYQRRVFLLHAVIIHYLDKVTFSDMLLVSLDDVDLARHRSEESLELIKVFLSHPRVVVVMTADLHTMRRAIRNRLLEELPPVLTGGTSAQPKDNDDGGGFASLFGAGKPSLIANEYLQDDGYAQAYLFKVLPPAHRCELRGLSPSERMTVKFPLGLGTGNAADSEKYDSLHSVLSRMPLLVDVISEDEILVCKDAQSVLSRFREYFSGAGGQTTLARICKTYQQLFPPNLRTLLNQLMYLRGLVDDAARDLEGILTGNAELHNEFESPELDRKPLTWSTRITTFFERASLDSNTVQQLKSWESRLVMKLIHGLALHPAIEAERPYFISYRYQANAFGANTVDEMWQLLDTVKCSGTGPLGARFHHQFAGHTSQELGDAANDLMSLVAEYALIRSEEPYRVLDEIDLDLDLLVGFDVAPLQILRWLKSDVGVDDPSVKLLAQSFRITTQFARGVGNKKLIRFTPRSSRLGPPIYIDRIDQAASFRQGLVAAMVRDQFGDEIRELTGHFDEFYSAGKDDEKSIVAPELDEALKLERELALGFLGRCAMNTRSQLIGLYSAFSRSRVLKPPVNAKAGVGRRDLPWVLLDECSCFWYLQKTLECYSDDKGKAFLNLLYVSGLNLAPLLYSWASGERSSAGPSSVLQITHDVLSQAQTALTKVDVDAKKFRIDINYGRVESKEHFGTWQMFDKSKPAVTLSGFSRVDFPQAWAIMAHEAPMFDLSYQCMTLSVLIDILLDIESHGPRIDDDGCPSVWRELSKVAVLRDAVKEALTEMPQFQKKGKD